MKCFALTGGIASGKTTVANMLAEGHVPVIDADVLARQVVEPGTPGHSQIVYTFGADYLDLDGNLDRARMATRIFSDTSAKQRLENIVHPLIAEQTQKHLKEYETNAAEYVVYIAPLIFEKNLQHGFDAVILVDTPVEKQVERITKRDGISVENAKIRVAAQMSREDKRKLADYIIDNSGTLDYTRSQLETLWFKLTAQSLFAKNIG